MHASLLRSPWDQERTEVPSSSTPGSSAGPWPREAPRPGRRVWTARQSRADARLPPTGLSSCSHSCSRHAASSDFPAARVSPCAGAWRGRGVPFLTLQLPFGTFTPRPLPVPTSNACQEALVPRTHVALAGLRRAEATWKIHGRVWVSDSDRPLPASWDGGHWAHRALPSQRGPGQAGGGTQPGNSLCSPPRAPRRLREPQAEQVVPFIG